MSKVEVFVRNNRPLPTESSRGIRCFSFPRLGSAHVPLHLLTAYLLPPPNCQGTVPLKNFFLCHFGRLSATLCLCLSLCLFSSCTRHPAPVTEALRHAGPNRQELKQLLAHYAQNPADSLKYRAACFLVENMRWHFGKKVTPSPNLWELFLLEDSLVRPWLQNSSYYKNDHGLHGYKYGAKKMLVWQAIGNSSTGEGFHPDITTIGADLLSQNIEMAFEAWESGWYPNLTFDEFCEYILPYRFNTEPVFPIRRQLRHHFLPLLQHDSLRGDAFAAMSWLNKYIDKFNWDWEEDPEVPDMGFYNIFYWQNSRMYCAHHIAIMGQVMRAAGLPVAEVYTPRWVDTNMGHSWCFVPNPAGGHTLFSAVYQQPGTVYKAHSPHRATKLYLRTFAAQPGTPLFLKNPGEEIPPGFADPCIKDVTGMFTHARRVETELTTPASGNALCWFAVFIRGQWEAVGWGTIDKERNMAVFEDIPLGLSGIAMLYQNGQLVPCSRLFTVTEDGAEVIAPSNAQVDITVTRKFPEKINLRDFVGEIVGAVIEGADNPGFDGAKVLGTIADTLNPYFQDIVLDSRENFRYYRMVAPQWSLHIAELEFLTRERLPGTSEASPLPVFGPGQPPQPVFYKFNGQMVAERPDSSAFDGDILTYNNKKRVGMDMGRRVTVDRIRVAPRNANNGIVPGNRYQLLYWDGRWVPHSTTVATHNYVTFGEVPGNTLYWLRNLDHGKEEQPFFYSGGRQVFANQ